MLVPADAIRLARDLLLRQGLTEVGRSSRGDSVYLRLPDRSGEIRVSTHHRTARRRAQYPGVATSIVIAAPTSRAKLEDRIAAALRQANAAGRHAG